MNGSAAILWRDERKCSNIVTRWTEVRMTTKNDINNEDNNSYNVFKIFDCFKSKFVYLCILLQVQNPFLKEIYLNISKLWIKDCPCRISRSLASNLQEWVNFHQQWYGNVLIWSWKMLVWVLSINPILQLSKAIRYILDRTLLSGDAVNVGNKEIL